MSVIDELKIKDVEKIEKKLASFSKVLEEIKIDFGVIEARTDNKEREDRIEKIKISLGPAALMVNPLCIMAAKDAMEKEERLAREQLCKSVESGDVALVRDSECRELKEECETFMFEFNRKSKSKEKKLSRKLRNGW